MRKFRVLLVGALVASGMGFGALTSSAAPATTVLVDGTNTTPDGAGCGSKANPCNTIQAGIDNASPGNIVRVRKGTYFGAVVNKAVALEAEGRVIVNDGPFSHPGMFRAGFLFNADHSGNGASIEGFDIVGAVQAAGDDGKLDFGIFSRGANDVTVKKNTLTNFLQGITDWNGQRWTIEKNKITDLWTSCGGGIGILVGGFDGSAILDHVVRENDVNGTVQVSADDCGGYDGTGIVLYADFRGTRTGASSISGNSVEKNKASLVSNMPELVNANGIEVTVADSTDPIITGNVIEKNHVKDTSGNGIAVSDGSSNNTFDKNDFKDSGETDAVDESTGTGTSGTANTWTHNHCDTSSPAGLCDHS